MLWCCLRVAMAWSTVHLNPFSLKLFSSFCYGICWSKVSATSQSQRLNTSKRKGWESNIWVAASRIPQPAWLLGDPIICHPPKVNFPIASFWNIRWSIKHLLYLKQSISPVNWEGLVSYYLNNRKIVLFWKTTFKPHSWHSFHLAKLHKLKFCTSLFPQQSPRYRSFNAHNNNCSLYWDWAQ